MIASLKKSVTTDHQQFRRDVYVGLSDSPKCLPSKYFYDRRGSQLFDQICEAGEYYVTRTELAIMRRFSNEIADCLSDSSAMIELGSGSSIKTRLLLDHCRSLTDYIPVDISGDHLQVASKKIRSLYPALNVHPIVADFTRPIDLEAVAVESKRTVYFPGSTIGNFEQHEAEVILGQIADLTGEGGYLLIGIDLQKDREVIHAAYNDRDGITADFNLNLLRRINRELDADFDLSAFTHRAHYDPVAGRVEMRLRSMKPQWVTVGERRFYFESDESIRTEYSHKYTIAQFTDLAKNIGLQLRQQWQDDRQYFAVLLFEKTPTSKIV